MIVSPLYNLFLYITADFSVLSYLLSGFFLCSIGRHRSVQTSEACLVIDHIRFASDRQCILFFWRKLCINGFIYF